MSVASWYVAEFWRQAVFSSCHILCAVNGITSSNHLKLMVWGNIVTSLFSAFTTKFCFFVNISIKLLSYRYMYIWKEFDIEWLLKSHSWFKTVLASLRSISLPVWLEEKNDSSFCRTEMQKMPLSPHFTWRNS